MPLTPQPPDNSGQEFIERAEPDAAGLAAGILSGDRSQLARAITLVESTKPAHNAIAQQLLQTVLLHLVSVSITL